MQKYRRIRLASYEQATSTHAGIGTSHVAVAGYGKLSDWIARLPRGFVLIILLGNLIKLVILVYPTHSSVTCFSGSKKVWVLLSYWYRYPLEYQQLD